MTRLGAFVRRSALLATVAIAVAASHPIRSAQAVELSDVSGWWISIDETFPKHWKSGAIAPMEEVLQINPDGRVSDRVMNFWAGSHRACLENKVCSDLPQIATGRVKVNSNRLSFINVVATNARLDTPSGDMLVRQEAITTAANWTITLDGERMTLRGAAPAKTRTFARIDLDRLRKLHAGMSVTSWQPREHWRCFLSNATARDKAFAQLQTNRSYSPPDFLDRYLNFASYIGAIKSAIAIPAIDESNEERRKLLSVEPEEVMVTHIEGLLRPPSVDDRQRLDAVLAYVERHTRAMLASNAATAVAAQLKSRADAAAGEAARLDAIAKEAAAATAAAQTRGRAAAAALAQARDAATAQTDAAKKAGEAARAAEAEATAKQTAAATALAAYETARRAAADQQQKVDGVNRDIADLQQKLQAAMRQAADLRQKSEAAQSAATAQQQKAETAVVVTAEQQRKLDAAKAAADAEQQKYQAAKSKADGQQQVSNKLAAAAREFADSLAAVQKGADEATVLLSRAIAATAQLSDAGGAPSDPVMSEAARDAAEATTTLQAALRISIASIKLAGSARDRAQSAATAAAALSAQLASAAQDAQSVATAAANAAKAAETIRDQARSANDTAAKDAADLARDAQNAERLASDARETVRATEAARDKAKALLETETREAARIMALSQTASLQSSEARQASDAAAAARDMARTESEAATREAARRTEAAQNAAKTAAAADEATKAAAQREQQAKVPADTAAQLSAKAKAEFEQATSAANDALEAMRAIAADQPKSENLTPITSADIAAYAQVFGETDAAKRLFCRGNYSVGATTEPEVAAPAAIKRSISDAETTTPAAVKTSAPDEPMPAAVPLPAARPASVRR